MDIITNVRGREFECAEMYYRLIFIGWKEIMDNSMHCVDKHIILLKLD